MDEDCELTFSDSECSCEDHSSANSDAENERDRQTEATTGQQQQQRQQQQQIVNKKSSNNTADDDERDEFAKSPSLKIEVRRKSRHTIIRHENENHHHRTRDDDNHHHHRRNERTKRSERLPIVLRNNGRRKSRERTPDKSARNGSSSVHRTSHNNSELLKYFFKDAIYFMVKSNNIENVDISMKDGVWSTPSQNEARWNSAFKQFRNVILVFSVKESGRFAGYARLSSQSDYDCEPVNWILPSGVAPFGGVFYIDWICKNELPFTQTAHLFNSFNDGKPVKIARDGQEIEPQVGEELCRLFPVDNTVDLIPHLKRMKKQTQNRKKTKHIRGPFMSGDERRSTNAIINGRQESYNQISRGQISFTNDGNSIGVNNNSSGGGFDRRNSRNVMSSSFDRSRLQLHSGNGSSNNNSLNSNGVGGGGNNHRSRASYHPYSRSHLNSGNIGGSHYNLEHSSSRHNSSRHYSRQNNNSNIHNNHSYGNYSNGHHHNNNHNHHSSHRHHDYDRDSRRTNIRSDRNDYY